ncbi:MAG: DNA (cytosine-5-)-methyltransferase [Thermotaleaceae bacterium]
MLAKQLSPLSNSENCTTIKLLSLFSGIGAFEKALIKLGIPFEIVNYCEIDKYASKVYSFIHNVSENLNLGDISKINPKTLQDFNLVTYGFPCQDISTAGKQAGIKEGTRSGLLYYALNIIDEKRPDYAIAENVKNLVGKRHKEDFEKLLQRLEEMGYVNYWRVLNGKVFGVPQNRERVFIVSVRKDVDRGFKFPEEFTNNLKLIDMLETEVDEKFYISEEKTSALLKDLDPVYALKASHTLQANNKSFEHSREFCTVKVHPCITPERSNKRQNGRRFKDENEPMFTLTGQDRHGVLISYNKLKLKKDGVSSCLDANYYKGFDNRGLRTGIIQVGKLDISGHDFIKRVYAPEGISPTLVASKQPKIVTNGNRHDSSNSVTNDSYKDCENYPAQEYKIRTLTPLECWRLMGFDDVDFYKAKYILNKTFYQNRDRSNSQLYKMAGNSIIVNLLVHLLDNLLISPSSSHSSYTKKVASLKTYYGSNSSKKLMHQLVNEKYGSLKLKHPDYLKRIA